MAPLHNRSNSFSVPPQQQVCRFHKFGFCKFRDKCSNVHPNQICPGGCSSINACNMRHPKTCRYFRDYGFCYLTNCVFAHRPTQKSLIRDCSQSILDLGRVLNDFTSKFFPKIDEKFKYLFTRVTDEVKGFLHDSRSSFISEAPQFVDHRTDDILAHDPEGFADSPVSSEGHGPSEFSLGFPVPPDPHEEVVPPSGVDWLNFEYDCHQGVYRSPCPCGDWFEIGTFQVKVGELVAECPLCCKKVLIVPDPETPVYPHPYGEEETNNYTITPMTDRSNSVMNSNKPTKNMYPDFVSEGFHQSTTLHTDSRLSSPYLSTPAVEEKKVKKKQQRQREVSPAKGITLDENQSKYQSIKELDASIQQSLHLPPFDATRRPAGGPILKKAGFHSPILPPHPSPTPIEQEKTKVWTKEQIDNPGSVVSPVVVNNLITVSPFPRTFSPIIQRPNTRSSQPILSAQTDSSTVLPQECNPLKENLKIKIEAQPEDDPKERSGQSIGGVMDGLKRIVNPRCKNCKKDVTKGYALPPILSCCRTNFPVLCV